MASYYVWSGATGSGNGSSWANAFITLTLAFATEVAGDTLYVAHDHAESAGAQVTLTSSGIASNPTKVICVNRTGSVPPVSADRRTTAQVVTTGNFGLTTNGCTHYDGIIFIAGNSTGAANFSAAIAGTAPWVRFDNCSLRLGGSGSGSRIMLCDQTEGAYVELNNTTVSFGNVAQGVDASVIVRWRSTPSAIVGATIPTALFTNGNSKQGHVECCGVDLSALGSGKTVVNAPSTTASFVFRFLDCKLDAAVTKAAVPAGTGTLEADFVRCDSAGTNYAIYRQRFSGNLTQEITIIRAGGASDGTTGISWKVTTTANCMYSLPFECPPVAIWNDTTGSARTATIEGIWGGGAVPNDDDVWLDLEYLGDASSPQGSFVNDGKADLLATAAGQTTSSATWGGSTTKFKLGVTFTAQQKGWVYARAKVGKASSTFYIDPKVTLS